MPKITKEQQNNIVTRILRSYDVQEIEFIRFSQDTKTGFYLLSVKINNNDEKRTTLSLSDLKILDNHYGTMGLNPVDDFAEYAREKVLEDTEPVDLSTIKIKYLGE